MKMYNVHKNVAMDPFEIWLFVYKLIQWKKKNTSEVRYDWLWNERN